MYSTDHEDMDSVSLEIMHGEVQERRKEMPPFLSVIVPIYNVEKYVKTCVESIVNQTFRDMEIILVDDGSPDGSGAICDEYVDRDSRIRVIHKKNGGVVSARREGVKQSSGRYITFVDGDDWIEAEMYAVMKQLLQDVGEVDVLSTDCYRDHDGELVKCVTEAEEGLYTGEKLRNLQDHVFYSGDFYHASITPNLFNKWYKRELIVNAVLGADSRITYGEDVICTYPCILEASSIYVYKEKIFYHYRFNPESIIEKYDPSYYQKYRYLYEFMDVYLDKKERPDLKRQLEYHKVYTMLMGIRKEVGKGRDILVGKSKERLLACFNSPDMNFIISGIHMSELQLPFPYKQLLHGLVYKRYGEVLFFSQMMRIWIRFFWKNA